MEQRGVEGALFDLQHVVRDVADRAGDGITVQCPQETVLRIIRCNGPWIRSVVLTSLSGLGEEYVAFLFRSGGGRAQGHGRRTTGAEQVENARGEYLDMEAALSQGSASGVNR